MKVRDKLGETVGDREKEQETSQERQGRQEKKGYSVRDKLGETRETWRN